MTRFSSSLLRKLTLCIAFVLGITVAGYTPNVFAAENDNANDNSQNQQLQHQDDNAIKDVPKPVQNGDRAVPLGNEGKTIRISDYINGLNAENDDKFNAVNAVKCSLREFGCVQSFRNSRGVSLAVYASDVSPVAPVKLNGAIGSYWAKSGWEDGRFGYPVRAEIQVGDSSWYQIFEKGIIAYTRGKGLSVIEENSPLRRYFENNINILGVPVNNIKDNLVNGGSVQSYINSSGITHAVYKSTNGIFSVNLDSPIGRKWSSSGWENGSFGYPTSEFVSNASGGYQNFEFGKLIQDSNGVKAVISPREALSKFASAHKNILGNPITDIKCGLKNDGCVRSFEKNGKRYALYTSANTVPQYVDLNSPIAKFWIKSGWENGKFGYPVSAVKSLNDGSQKQEFENGIIFQSGSNAIELLNDSDYGKYYKENSRVLSHPMNNLVCSLADGGCVQTFKNNNGESVALYKHNGRIVPVNLSNPNIIEWKMQGWENSPLGYPTESRGSVDYFENGYIKGRRTTITKKQVAFERFIRFNQNKYGNEIVRQLRCGLRDGGCVATIKNNGIETAIYITPNNGVVPIVLREETTKKWIASGWENSSYGYPIAPIQYEGGIAFQKFEHGIIKASSYGYPAVISRMNGIDISSWQKNIQLNRIQNIQFVIVKATGGTGYVNPFHQNQVDEAIRLNKKIGFYHFAHEAGSKGDPVSEAYHFVNTIKPYLRYGPMLVLDNEQSNRYDVNWNKKWLDTVYSLTGVKPMIYMSQDTVNHANWSSVANAGYPLWVAYYPYNAPKSLEPERTPTFVIKWWNRAAMWQYTSNLRLDGYNANLDGNVFYGDNRLWAYYALPR